jgi:hypothetical protein
LLTGGCLLSPIPTTCDKRRENMRRAQLLVLLLAETADDD